MYQGQTEALLFTESRVITDWEQMPTLKANCVRIIYRNVLPSRC